MAYPCILEGKLTVCYSKNLKMDFVMLLRLFRNEQSVLFMAKSMFPMPFFDILRNIRGKVFVAVVTEVGLKEILGHIERFSAVILSDLDVNNFELAFLKKHCQKFKRTVMVITRMDVGVPFMSDVLVDSMRFSEVFYEDFR